ncbi:NUDIX domain-containing protein [Halobacillus trueperi]|uniref:NUDIX domain-containing protein n=1 Tax=Halobacillus trueperi TaxID=156205 RepID=UPI0037351A32
MTPVKKAYGYVTRIKEGQIQVLVFQHPISEAGIQIPKGTVEPVKDPQDAVLREMEEETGLRDFHIEQWLAEDLWKNDDGAIHHRFFYKLSVSNVEDGWDHEPTGGEKRRGLRFISFGFLRAMRLN